MVRIAFKNEFVRNSFFQDILNYSSLRKWKKLRDVFNIPRKNLENYRTGLITLPEELYKKLILVLPDVLNVYYSSCIDIKENNWGCIKGGKNNYIKNKHIYEFGRKKAWKTTYRKYKDIQIPIEQIGIDFYEVLGTFIGDGFFNKYGNRYMIQFAGDSRYDFSYYKDTIIPVLSKLMNRKPYIRIKENSMWVTFYSKALFNLLLKFNMPLGKKVYTVKIPDEVIDDKTKLICTLRGIFDTDGCIFVDKRRIYREPYVRIALQLTNKVLIDQVSNGLIGLGIKCGVSKKVSVGSYILQINGFDEVKKYLYKVGFSNERHLKKLSGFNLPINQAFGLVPTQVQILPET